MNATTLASSGSFVPACGTSALKINSAVGASEARNRGINPIRIKDENTNRL